MNLDHFRDVVWKPALKKAGLEYRPPIQTRHTFATMMLSAGEDIGWVQAMLGHSSLQMIFTRYCAWIPRKTRQDGSAFMEAVKKKCGENHTPSRRKKHGEKMDVRPTHLTKLPFSVLRQLSKV
jgi:integrase